MVLGSSTLALRGILGKLALQQGEAALIADDPARPRKVLKDIYFRFVSMRTEAV